MLFRTSIFLTLLCVAQAQNLPEGPGKAVVMDKCSMCHGIEIVAGMVQSRTQWDATISSMVDKGADLNAESYAAILDYLGTYLSPKVEKINVNKADAKTIETGLEVTPKEAEAIVKYREAHGAFKDWHDLTKVDGVDAKKIEAKKDVIALE